MAISIPKAELGPTSEIRAYSNLFTGVSRVNSQGAALYTEFITQSASALFFINILNSRGYTTAATFKAWLRSLYNAGTPLIIQYLAANPIVETISLPKIEYHGGGIVSTNNIKPSSITFSV